MNLAVSTARKPWRAVLMSLILPGFGQLYNGQAAKATCLFLAFTFFTVPAVALAALYVPSGMMAPLLAFSLLASACIWLFGMVDAWRVARTLAGFTARRWQSGATYVLALVLCHGLTLPLLAMYVREHLVVSFHTPSTSMEPGVLKGDDFFVDKRYNCAGCERAVMRGDVVLFTYPKDRTQIYIKRVIGLPGDKVEVRAREVSVNGKALSAHVLPVHESGQMNESWGERSWPVAWIALPLPSPDASLTVPAGQVFVLGDNRSNSLDSRYFGAVPLGDVIGKARQVWFSVDDAGVRAERIGKVIE